MAVPPAAFVVAALGGPESPPCAVVFPQVKIDHCMFIGDATDPVKRIGTGGPAPNRQTHGQRGAGGSITLVALAVDLPTCRLGTLRQRLRLDKENYKRSYNITFL
jgi:hypothetical protein